MSTVAVVAHSGKSLGGGLLELRRELERQGVRAADAPLLIALARADPETHSPARLKVPHYREQLLADLNRERPAVVDTTLRQLRTTSPCELGEPGGAQPHPTTGHPLCPLCRRTRQEAS